ncbi:DNA repair protein RecO [Candidatus Woesebacteria bacterium RIFCSPHIGHO2_01_FULL_44_21]|uniref:DNA repair protein RecO n=1 Tax=Candidatus Woesebacteria bacterium RIFCSPHIGHO2_01_FULL_44_21 TaxID=1802503 RepID=A0A1F7YVB9_9BACT|nr:MAG: DNA repair protein RecO [Candidatus Woesebacteria bacterium RIFCSPHIGHO2_01_FULL_44_21]
MRSFGSNAVVLSAKSYSEADKIITVFSKDFGKLTLMAKGVKRLKSRKRGSLEVFSNIKFFAHKGRGMPVVTEVEIIDNFVDLRKDLKKVSVAYFFAEVVARTTRDEEEHAEIYVLLVNYLKRLEVGSSLKKLRTEFSLEIAEILGFIPKGQFVPNPDEMLESIIERKLGSVRVGKKLQV